MGERTKEESGGDVFVLREREVDTQASRVRVATLICEPLEKAGFLNAFSTRLGGVSPLPENALNLAYFKGDDKDNVVENRKRFRKAIGAESIPLITTRQTHSTDRFLIEVPEHVELPEPSCDALITRMRGVLLAIQTADCLPVLIGDPKSG